MTSDEQAIRLLIETFNRASETGDLGAARSVTASDATFLVGAVAMDRDAFTSAATATSDDFEFDLATEIREVKVFGDHAYAVVQIKMSMTPTNGEPTTYFGGYSLSILEKRQGSWLIVRDANTMVSVDGAE